MARPQRLSQIPPKLTLSEFWDVFGKVEHESLDFKQQAKDLAPTVAAMAMTDGGLIPVGVSDKRLLVGGPLDQKLRDRLAHTSHDCGVDLQYTQIDVDGVPVTIVAVPEVRGRIVTTPDGRLLRRVGSHNQPVTGDAMARFVREREERSAEDEPVPELRPGDIDLAGVNRALAEDGRAHVTRKGVMRALVDLGLADISTPPLDPQPLRAAAVLFAKDPTEYVSGAAVQLVRRTGVGPGPGPTAAREEVRGPLLTVLAKSLAFVDHHTARHETVVGTHREVIAEYPDPVLREALLNALAHRDYGLVGSTVDVTIWDDRIEIQSPGPLPGPITVDNMRDEHYSRNRRIMRVLKLLNLVEEYGEGVDRMFSEMEARLMQPPDFVATQSSVTVTLHNRSLLSVEDQAWLSLLGHIDLSLHERRALVLARHEQAITPRRLRAVLGPQVDVDALLAGAMAKGVLVQEGRRGGTRYVLSDEVVMRAGVRGVEARSRKRQMLLDEIRRRGSLSTVEASDYLADEDRNLVRQLLNDLARNGDVIAEGRTRGRRYYSADGPRQTTSA